MKLLKEILKKIASEKYFGDIFLNKFAVFEEIISMTKPDLRNFFLNNFMKIINLKKDYKMFLEIFLLFKIIRKHFV